MKYHTERMDNLITAARVAAGLSAVLAVIQLAVAVGRQSWRPGGISVFLTEYAVALYLVPAALLAALAWRMDRGDTWAYVATAVLSFVLLMRVLLGMAATMVTMSSRYSADVGLPVVGEGISRLPCIMLCVGSLNAMADVREQARRRRQEKQYERRGFEPIITGSASTPPSVAPPLPPRPATLSRRPAAPGRFPPTPPPP